MMAEIEGHSRISTTFASSEPASTPFKPSLEYRSAVWIITASTLPSKPGNISHNWRKLQKMKNQLIPRQFAWLWLILHFHHLRNFYSIYIIPAFQGYIETNSLKTN